MVAGLFIHLITYVAVCGFLTLAWVLTGGSFDELSRMVDDPAVAFDTGFWPIWVILGWGLAVVLHAGVVLSIIVFGGKRRRQRKRLRAARTEAKIREAREAPLLTPGPVPKTKSADAVAARKWVTVMFTDIVSSTSLNEELGDEDWSRLLARYRETVREAFLARAGEEVGTQGDGFLARFPTPAEAILCGVDVQRDVEKMRSSDNLPIEVKIGIHAGEAVEDDGDLIGRVINLAARVTTEAGPGEILVTEPVADYVGSHLHLEDRGLRPLRGVTQPRHLLAVVWADEPAEAESRNG